MQIKISVTNKDSRFKIYFQNDPLIEKFFEIESNNAMYEDQGHIFYKVNLNKIDPFYSNSFQSLSYNRFKMYYDNRALIKLLTIKRSSLGIYYFYDGLLNIEKWINDFNNETKIFVDKVIKPYWKTRKYVESKGNKIQNGMVINKEGFEKFWHSYYRNYKKNVLTFNEVLSN